RSGVFLLIFSFLLFFEFTILYFQREKESQKVIKNFLKVTLLIITFFALYIGIDSVIERFNMDNLLREARPVFWKQTVDIVGDFPLFGTGLGTFAFVYPVYEEVPSSGFLSHAHNDYLEYLSELGIIGFAILLGGILYLLVNSILRWRERHHPQVKGIALGGIISIIVMLLHSISDFNLHIPANMLLFSVVLSLTVVTVFYKSRNARNEHTVAGKEKSRTGDDTSERSYQKEIEEWRKFINQKSKFDFKTILSVVAVVMLGVIAIIIYWNQHLYYRSKTIENADQKMKVLNHANKLHPLNDLVHYELGKAGFSIGVRNIENNEVRDFYLQDSVANYEKSLRINPLSPFSHFYLGQVLYYMSYLEPGGPFGEQTLQRSNEEYKKAAKLAGYYGEITHEVGKIYLSRWDELSEEEREFTINFIKKKITEADKEQILDLLHVWEMNVRDYSVMQEILPEQIHVLRLYAKFLGEKSLSADERQRILAEKEFKEFERARQEFKSGENAFMYMHLSKASKHYE
ncbi:MAG: O-antigen ligase family protein, partial [Gammaproteobacteria bacterium]|nr:O-antigen ligase family protein [Gammaproteobacteria bacterium]